MIWPRMGARPGCVLNHSGPPSVPTGPDQALEGPPEIGTPLLAESMVCSPHKAPTIHATAVAELSPNAITEWKIFIFDLRCRVVGGVWESRALPKEWECVPVCY